MHMFGQCVNDTSSALINELLAQELFMQYIVVGTVGTG
jgi:hypothetical protein